MLKTRYAILRPGKIPEGFEIDLPAEPGYELLRDLIEPIIGAPFEHVWTLGGNLDRASMFVDECGQLKGLEYNSLATYVYRAASVLSGADPESLPTIVGPAVLFDRRVWF